LLISPILSFTLAVAVVAVVIVGRSRNCTMMPVDPLLRVCHRDPWNKHLEAHPIGVDGPSYVVAQDAAEGLALTMLQFGMSLSAA